MKLIQFLLFAALYASLQTANACELPIARSKITDRPVDVVQVAANTMNVSKANVSQGIDNGQSERSSGQVINRQGK